MHIYLQLQFNSMEFFHIEMDNIEEVFVKIFNYIFDNEEESFNV